MKHSDRPEQNGQHKADVLIVGTGMAGLSAATELQQNGHNVIAFDNGHGVGGRLASRHIGLRHSIIDRNSSRQGILALRPPLMNGGKRQRLWHGQKCLETGVEFFDDSRPEYEEPLVDVQTL